MAAKPQLQSKARQEIMMSEFDFDLDHLDFEGAEKKTAQQQLAADQLAAEQAAIEDDSDDCSGGACKI
jgi:hypothetical protein